MSPDGHRPGRVVLGVALCVAIVAFVLSALHVLRLTDLSFIVPALLFLAAAGLLVAGRGMR